MGEGAQPGNPFLQDFILISRDHEYLGVRHQLAQARNGLVAVHLLHFKVEQNNVRLEHCADLNGLAAV